MTSNITSPKTRYYISENDDEECFKLDQTILYTRKNIRQVFGITYKEDNLEELNPFVNEWYPLANSYYVHTEDVDAQERVNYLLAEDLPPNYLDTKRQSVEKDPLSEKLAQQKFLASRPVSFIILGKPGIGEEDLGRKIAELWQCEYIEPQALIEEEIEAGTNIGNAIEFNLRLGRAVEIDEILKLVEKRVKSETSKHRGFILCGLPMIPNDLYVEDLMSTPSTVFNAKDVLEEVVDLAIDVANMIDPSTLKVDSSNSDEPLNFHNYMFKRFAVPKDLGSEEYFNNTLKIGQDYDAQLKFIFDLMEEPFLIVYIKCETKDVLRKRDNYRYNIKLNEFYDMQLVNFYQKMLYHYLRNEDCIVDDIFDSEYLLLEVSHLRGLVILPHNFKAHVATQVDRYNKVARKFIEKQVLLHDHQYIIKVDGRITVARNFRIVRARLRTLPLQKVVLPRRVIIPDSFIMPGKDCDWDFNFCGEADDSIDRIPTPYEYFSYLSTVEIIHNRFPWTLSDWGVRCPVSLSEGKVVNGDVQYVIRFMNRLFFLANEEAFLKFYRNPRPYLLPPYPSSPCQIFIFGPKNSGRTALAKCLGYYFNCKVIKPEEILTTYVQEKKAELKEIAREIAKTEAIRILDEKRGIEAQEKELQRQAAIADWYNSVSVLIKEYIEHLERERKPQSPEASATVVQSLQSELIIMSNSSEFQSTADIVVVNEMLKAYNVTETSTNPMVWQAYLEQKEKLLVFLPEDIRYKIHPCPALLFDDFVVDYIDDAVSKTILDTTDITLEKAFSSFLNKIRQSKSESSIIDSSDRWIIDGMVCDTDLIESLYPDHIGSEIIMLDDHPNAEYLIKKLERQEFSFPDYRSFFAGIDKADAVYRTISETSTASYKEGLIRNILYDILDSNSFYDNAENSTPTERKIRAYKQDILKFRESWKRVKDLYITCSCQLLEINVADKSYPELFSEVIRKIEDNYRRSASRLTTRDREAELKVCSDDKKVFNDDVRAYGDTSYYCPVTYHEKLVLWKGKENHAVKFENKIYLMSTEEDVKKFIEEPRKFLSQDREKEYPPPRVCVTGYLKSGKTTISRLVAENLGLNYISYEDLIRKWFDLNPEDTFESLKVTDNFLHEELLSYLFLNKALPSDKLEKMAAYWFQEPYKSLGIVIDDFPKRETDIQFMLQNRLIPDVVIQLEAPLGCLRSQILEEVVSSWREKVNQRIAWEEANKTNILEREQQRKQRFDELMEESREKRYILKKQEQSGSKEDSVTGSMSQVSFDSVAEQEDIEEINKILEEELPAITYEEDIGSLDVIIEKLERNLIESLNFEGVFLNKIRDVCDKELIPYRQIPLNVMDMENTKIRLFRILDEYKFRGGLFERCYDVISLDVAYRLLSCGYFFLSRFGKNCPVKYYKNQIPVQLYLPMIPKQNVFPVIHRSYIYFIIGPENKEEFKRNPLKYLNVIFIFPTMVINIAVTGPPKCGKSTLSRRIKDEFGFKVVTRGQSVRYVLNYLPYSVLKSDVEELLRRGEELPSDILMRCVESTFYDPRVVSQGIILDGFPNTIDEVKCLAVLDLIPNVVIDLTAKEEEILECLSNDTRRYIVPKYSKRFMQHLYNEWSKSSTSFRHWFEKEYQVTATIPINTTNWSVFHQSNEIVKAVIFEIKHYFAHAYDDWPLRLANMLVTPLEFVERRSHYKDFCPVCLHVSNTLVCGGNPPDRTGLIQYRDRYYWICRDHEELFIKSPEQYLPPYNNHTMPVDTPKIVTLAEKPVKNLFARGFCVVCYKNFIAETEGKVEFAVQYRDNIYLFDKQECMNVFFKHPQRYMHHDFVVPNVDYPSLDYKDLPVLGMLEQYVAKYVVKALSFIAKKRPIVPGLGLAQSAVIGIGITLKVNNERLKQEYVQYYREGYDLYCERCENLLTYLDRMKCMINPYLHYEEPFPEFKPPVTPSASESESDDVFNFTNIGD